MDTTRRTALLSLALGAAFASPGLAQPAAAPAPGVEEPPPNAPPASPAEPSFQSLEAQQGAANSQPGPRMVPARRIPVPETVSPQLRTAIAAPYRVPAWNANPGSAEEWRALIARLAAPGAAAQPAIRERLGVTMETTTLGGVRTYVLTPRLMPPANRKRLLVHVHGGGYVYNPGEAGTQEATLMAAFGGFKVLSFDYRMPPDHPYPAAMDDAMAVWKAATRLQKPQNMAIFGTSTGGGMTLAMILRAKRERLPMPAAIGPGTPWSDLTETGDSYKTNEWLDNILVSYQGYLKHAAELYAHGHDLKDPQLSPIYGDFRGFPPTILTSGTRDLFLSNTVRTHRKLRQAGVEADLQVYEGMSHAQYMFDPYAPETREAFTEIAGFFNKHLGR